MADEVRMVNSWSNTQICFCLGSILHKTPKAVIAEREAIAQSIDAPRRISSAMHIVCEMLLKLSAK